MHYIPSISKGQESYSSNATRSPIFRKNSVSNLETCGRVGLHIGILIIKLVIFPHQVSQTDQDLGPG